GSGKGKGGAVAQRVLGVAQVAAAFLLSTGAGVLAKSVLKTLYYDPGYEIDHLITTQLQVRGDSVAGEGGIAAAERGCPSIAGVMSTAGIGWGQVRTRRITVDGHEHPTWIPSRFVGGNVLHEVSPSFLRTLGVPIVQGRDFTEKDRQPQQPTVAIV